MRRFFSSLLALTVSISAHAEITLTFGGDLNLNPSRGRLHPDGAWKYSQFYSWQEMFSHLLPLIDGDLNFANLETVVSENPNLPDSGGRFVFNTHINGIAYAIQNGFNFFSLANNHTGDYGRRGMEETLYSMSLLQHQYGPIFYGGLEESRSRLLQPIVIPLQTPQGTFRVAFMAMTGLSNAPTQAREDRAGTLYFWDDRDLTEALSALRNVDADYKIFSVHWGSEGRVTLNSGQRSRYHYVLEQGDVDLILGHHPHRVRPVEKVGHKVIFYSLGNYLMLGAANINDSDDLYDYGLLGKLHLQWDPRQRRLVAQAAEAIALTDVHFRSRPLAPAQGQRRISALNRLGFDQLGSHVLEFDINSQGFGQACLGDLPGPRAQNICR